MKRYIKASSVGNELLIKSKDGNFELVQRSGIAMNDTPYTGLRVISKGLAEKHVVEVRLESKFLNSDRYNGEPIKHSYYGVNVAHGMRNRVDTLEDTEEYIRVMQSALNFAYEVLEYLEDNDWMV